MSRSVRASALIAAAAAFGLFASQASASIFLAKNDANYLGSVVPGEPASPAEEVEYINNLISVAANDSDTIDGHDYVRSALDDDFPTAVEAGGVKEDSGANTTTLTGLYKYILAKYDGPNGGDLVWYFASGVQLSDIVLPLKSFGNGDAQYGLSHFSAYNPTTGGGGVEEIPEPVSLAVWSVLGLAGLGAVCARRRS